MAVTSSDWVAVTLAYIGSQALVDLAVKWKHGPTNISWLAIKKLLNLVGLAKTYWQVPVLVIWT